MPNRLAREASPYLQQHAQNPVDWYPWGAEALERAKREDKPILLSIGYSACHWCHVMERETFEDEATAELMNDVVRQHQGRPRRAARPRSDLPARRAADGAQRRLAAHGLPHAGPEAVLRRHVLSAGRPLRHARLPARCSSRSPRRTAARREEVDAQAEELTEAIAEVADRRRRAPQRAVSPELARAARRDEARGALRRRARRVRGAPQVSEHDVPRISCCAVTRAGDRERACKALDAMRAGGICDQLGGGFHRYSTDERWLVPHFEKMLYDNALLLRLYADALARHGRAALRADGARHRGVRRARDDGARRRLLRDAGRGQRRRGGEVLRLDAGRDRRRLRGTTTRPRASPRLHST